MYHHCARWTDKPYPVADDFFEPISLTKRQLCELRQEAADALLVALMEREMYQASPVSFLVNSPPWKLHTQHEGLSEYQRPHRTREHVNVSRVFGSVPGEYRDIASVFKSETREEYFTVQKKFYPYTVDAAVLCSVPQRPIEDSGASSVANEAVKWAAYEPFWLRFRMDTCHFESTGTGIDSNGKPYAFRIVIPAESDQVPDLFQAKRTVRMDCKSVLIVSPSDLASESSELFMTMQYDFKCNRVPRSMYKRWLITLHSLSSLTDGKYEWNNNTWRRVTTQRACSQCERRFTLLRSKHNCTLCGDAVCRKCCVRSTKPQHTTRKLKLCPPCHAFIQEEAAIALATPMLGDRRGSRLSEIAMGASRMLASFHSTSSSSSSSTNSRSDWATASNKARRARSRLGTSMSDSSSASSSLTGSHNEPARSPVLKLTDMYDQVSNFGDDGGVIVEEGSDLSSQRSDDYITIDTSDMERVRTESLSLGSDVFESIRSTLHEQEILLRQLQQATGSFYNVHRNTSGATPRASVF